MARRAMVSASMSDADQTILRLQHVAGPGQDQRNLLVGDRHHGFQPAQVAVGPPVLGQFDTGAGQLAGMLFQLCFQPLEQGEGIRRGAGKAGNDRAIANPADLFGIGLDDGGAQADLAVAGDHDAPVLAHRQDGGAVPEGLVGIGHKGPAE